MRTRAWSPCVLALLIAATAFACGGSSSAKTGTVVGHLANFGRVPTGGDRVTISGSSGPIANVEATSTGSFKFSVPAGRYTLNTIGCTKAVTVQAGKSVATKMTCLRYSSA
jgi:hypothetical protein